MKILEVNNIDTVGRVFNGYNLQKYLNKQKNIKAKQAVIYKFSNDKNVERLLELKDINFFQKLEKLENDILFNHSQLSLTTNLLLNNKYYKESDIIHFHQFHNSKISLYSLIDIYKEKKIVISLHDPWFMTGRCVHPYNCTKWKKGCNSCEYLENMFSSEIDNSKSNWLLKKYIFDNIKCEIIVSSKFMYDMVKKSKILKNQNINYIPLGIDINKFKPIDNNEILRKKYKLNKDDFVIFLRAQNEFKGTKYVLEALKKLRTKQKIVVLTCDKTNLLDEIKNKYKIIDFGICNSDLMIDLYRMCDLFLMPSSGESFGMMAVEAMACAKPVVVFNNTALPSVVHAPECGILVEDKDVRGLTKAIEWMIKDDEERSRRGSLGRQIVVENYNIDDCHKKILDLYKKIYNKKITQTKLYINESIKENQVRDLEILKKRLKKIIKILKLPNKRDFKFLKNNFFVKDNKLYLIDYSNYWVQELIKKFNLELYKSLNYVNDHHPVKTAIKLLIFNRKEFLKKIKEKLKV